MHLLTPSNRSGDEWAGGLKYGIEMEPFNSAGFSSKYYGQYLLRGTNLSFKMHNQRGELR